jgi:ribonuclease P protein component
MFKKGETINSREFKIIQKKGKKSFTHFFRGIINGNLFKITVVVPKKIYKKRVQRNTQKRRLTHALKNISDLPNKNIIIFVQKDISKLSFIELQNSLSKLFIK